MYATKDYCQDYISSEDQARIIGKALRDGNVFAEVTAKTDRMAEQTARAREKAEKAVLERRVVY